MFFFPFFRNSYCYHPDNGEKDREIEKLKEEMKKIKYAQSFVPEKSKCFHEYNQNLTGYWVLLRNGCICKKEVDHE
jgi:hypothetical protein